MADEITQTEVKTDKNPLEPRLQDLLSDKAHLSQTVADKDKQLEQLQNEKKQLEQEKAFSDGFADVLGIHAAAKDHRDEIKAKVIAGYSVEDAAYAVLGKAGKLGGAPAVVSPAGGSADTTVTTTTQKSAAEMSQAERRAELEKALVIG